MMWLEIGIAVVHCQGLMSRCKHSGFLRYPKNSPSGDGRMAEVVNYYILNLCSLLGPFKCGTEVLYGLSLSGELTISNVDKIFFLHH